jgi:hypothetical protein
MASVEQRMEVIQQAVSAAVAAAMREMGPAGGGGSGRPQSMQQVVDTTIKRMDRFVKEGFADWKFKLEMGLRGCHPRMAEILKYAEEQDGPIDVDLMEEEDQGTNHNLYIILAQITGEEAFDVVKNVEGQNGAEAFRRLCRRFSGKTRGKRLQMIRRSVNPSKIKKLSEVMGMIEKWETNLRRLQADFKEELSNGLRTGILLEMMPGDVAEHLSQKVNDDDKYEDVKEMVLRYIETRADCDGIAMDIGAVNDEEADHQHQHHHHHQPGDLEQGELYFVKGKGKGQCHICGEQGHFARECPKGGSKGKGKEKGKGKFHGACWVCGEFGHSSRFCPKGDVKGYGKSKGFGKNYGGNFGKGFGEYGKGQGWQDSYGMKGGKGKGWSAYGIWEDDWSAWDRPGGGEHLPLCGVEVYVQDTVKKEPMKPLPRVCHPPGLKCHNMFQELMEDECQDENFQEGCWDFKGNDDDFQNDHVSFEDVPLPMCALFCPEEEVNHLRAEKKWARLEAVIDSGAAESVAPASMAPWVPLTPSEGSRRGQCYMSANGAKLPNMGEKRFTMMTGEGNMAEATFQVAEVTRPLCSVTKICDRGNRVVFDAKGGYIENFATGVQTRFSRQNNVYVMDMYLEEGTTTTTATTSGFTRQRV